MGLLRKLRERKERRRREKEAREAEKALQKQKETEKLEDVQDDLNSLFGTSEDKVEIVETEDSKPPTKTEIFRLTDEEKKEILESVEPVQETEFDKRPKTRLGRIGNFIKKHVRPDIGLTPFKEGEGPDYMNDDIQEIGDKLKKNLKVGLKMTIKF